MRLIFLDVDGVLNAHEPLCPLVMCGQIHDDKAAMLKTVLIETDSRIVLSSAWRYLIHRGEMNLIGINWLFRSHGLPHESIIGITDPDTMERPTWDGSQPWPVADERGLQIHHWRWVNNHTDRYAVIDDLDLGISAAGHPFVQTDGKVGLTQADADRLIELLRNPQ